MEEAGKRIRQIRGKESLVSFGEKLGLSKSAVHQYEQGVTTPTLETLVKIAKLGNTSLDWLIAGREPEAKPEKPSQTDIMRAALKTAITGDKTLVEEIKESFTSYAKKDEDPEVLRLVDAYWGADPKIRRAALRMLEDDAKESCGNGGGENDSPCAKSG